MNADQREPQVVRITLLLGGGETTHSALELLNQLAWNKSIEALGIFIEDSNLLRLAQMPFSQELCRVTYVEAPLEKADIERQLRIQARTARQAFASAATQAGINHSFLTRRGGLAALLQQAAQKPGGSIARYRCIATTDIETLLETCRSERAGTLVMGISDLLLKTRFLQELSYRLEFPALLVR